MTAKAVGWVALTLMCSMATGTEWVKRYDGPAGGNDEAAQIAVSAANVPYVVGYTTGSDDSKDFLAIRYDPNSGDTTTDVYSCVPGSGWDDEALAVVVGTTGNVFVTGYSSTYWVHDSSEAAQQYTTMKYSLSLARQYTRHYQYVTTEDDDPPDAAASAVALRGDTAYVTGYCYMGENRGNDALTEKLRPLGGDSVWTRAHNRSSDNDDAANDVAVDGQGKVYVVGMSWTSTTGSDFLTLKYAPGGGSPLWAKYLTSAGFQDDEARAVCVVDSDHVYVTGVTGAGGGDFLTVCYKANGDTVWVRQYGGPGRDEPAAMAVDDSGCVYVTGWCTDNGKDFQTVKYRPDGSCQWDSTYDGPAHGDDAAAAIAIDSANCVYVAGFRTDTGGIVEYYTLKYSSDGVPLDSWTYSYQGDDRAVGVGLPPTRWTLS